MVSMVLNYVHPIVELMLWRLITPSIDMSTKSLPRGQEDTSFENTLENAVPRYQDVVGIGAGVGYLLDDIVDKIKSPDLELPISHQSSSPCTQLHLLFDFIMYLCIPLARWANLAPFAIFPTPAHVIYVH